MKTRITTFPHALLTIVLGIFLLADPAQAANQTVTSLADSGAGSLREAIAAANNSAGNDTIEFAAELSGTIQLASALPDLSTEITINGPGANVLTVKRNAGGNYRIFTVRNGTTTGPAVTISGLAITGGNLVPGGDGGGGIFNYCGTLTVANCWVWGNKAGAGGGILNEARSPGTATLTVRESTVSANGGTHGGGIYNYAGNGSSANITLQNSTLRGNFVTVAPEPIGGGKGGGIFNTSVGNAIATLVVQNTTFAGNMATQGVSIYNSFTDNVQVGNSLFQKGAAAPHFHNFGTFTSLGYNLSDDDGAGLLGNTGDQTLTDPLLDPAGLRNNGGGTPTIALQVASPAMDKGNSPVSIDQRGLIRPIDFPANANVAGGNASDIGAFERQDPSQSGPAFLVNTAADHDDGTFGEVDCTLREAIRAANLSTGVITITFAPGVTGTITLDSQLGQLDVTNPVTLAGPGARKLALSGENGARPILFFAIGSSGSAVSGLTLRDAQRIGSFVDGAGLVNLGMVTVADCAFVNNVARSLSGSQPGQIGGEARGGAIFNGGTLTLHRCTFNANAARGGNGANNLAQFGRGGNGGAAEGGAVFNNTAATLTIRNCTFSNNSGVGGAGGNGPNFGGGSGGNGNGGVFNRGTMTMTACTLGGNTGTGGARGLGNNPLNNGANGAGRGGLTADGGTNTVRNTISAGNTGTAAPDASGDFASGGYNLIGKSNGSTGFTAKGDQTGSSAAPLDARLGLFQNNGGPTDTFLLLAGSPASDKGRAFSLGTDQRNLPRLYDAPGTPNASGGDGTDIGAVEMQPDYSGPLKVLSLTLVGPTARVVIQGTNSVSYQLQKADVLTSTLGASFANIGTPQLTDSIGQTEFTDFGPLPAQRFYRAFKP